MESPAAKQDQPAAEGWGRVAEHWCCGRAAGNDCGGQESPELLLALTSPAAYEPQQNSL